MLNEEQKTVWGPLPCLLKHKWHNQPSSRLALKRQQHGRAGSNDWDRRTDLLLLYSTTTNKIKQKHLNYCNFLEFHSAGAEFKVSLSLSPITYAFSVLTEDSIWQDDEESLARKPILGFYLLPLTTNSSQRLHWTSSWADRHPLHKAIATDLSLWQRQQQQWGPQADPSEREAMTVRLQNTSPGTTLCSATCLHAEMPPRSKRQYTAPWGGTGSCNEPEELI